MVWPAFFVALSLLMVGPAWAECTPKADTPQSIIEYFQKFNKPLPDQFCEHGGEAPEANGESAPEDNMAEAPPEDVPPPAYGDESPPPAYEPKPYELEPVPEPRPRYAERGIEFGPHHLEFRFPRFRFRWEY
jgi:hypothetical protein